MPSEGTRRLSWPRDGHLLTGLWCPPEQAVLLQGAHALLGWPAGRGGAPGSGLREGLPGRLGLGSRSLSRACLGTLQTVCPRALGDWSVSRIILEDLLTSPPHPRRSRGHAFHQDRDKSFLREASASLTSCVVTVLRRSEITVGLLPPNWTS